MQSDRINAYRCMWVFVLFDLPTDTKKQRRDAQIFRKKLLKDGFNMFQFSIYLRHCPSKENADVHANRVTDFLPPYGFVSIIYITDKQWGMVKLFHNARPEKPSIGPQQLELW
jgi:CRISPR-associated protein Cas2